MSSITSLPYEILRLILNEYLSDVVSQQRRRGTFSDPSKGTDVERAIFNAMRTCRLWANVVHEMLWGDDWDWQTTNVYKRPDLDKGVEFVEYDYMGAVRRSAKRRDLGRCIMDGETSNMSLEQRLEGRWKEMMRNMRGYLGLWVLFHG